MSLKTYRPLQERPVIAMSASLQSHVLTRRPRNPNRAAVLSLCPGLGQIYNGETGKGLLFLLVFLSNAALLLSIACHDLVLGTIGRLASAVGWQVDPQAIKWFASVPAGSPFLIIYAALIATFIAYASREAKDRAVLTGQGAVYPKFFLDLPEATSGSYLFHFAIMVTGLIMMLFIVAPKQPTEQVTNIILEPPPPAPPPPKPKVETPKPKPKMEEPKKPEVTPPQPKVEPKVEPVVTEPTPVPVAAAPAPVASAPASDSSGGTGSPSGTGGGTGSSEGQDIDFGPYLAEMQKRIKKNWFPPRGTDSKRITVKFTIHQNGEITSLKLEKSSGLSIADDAATEAIEKTSPLPPLPKGADADLVIKFTFDYNVFNGGNNQSAASTGTVGN